MMLRRAAVTVDGAPRHGNELRTGSCRRGVGRSAPALKVKPGLPLDPRVHGVEGTGGCEVDTHGFERHLTRPTCSVTPERGRVAETTITVTWTAGTRNQHTPYR